MDMDSLLDFEKQGGLVPAIAQDYQTGEVLMLAYMNQAAFSETIRTGRACYYSRSRHSSGARVKSRVMCSASMRSASTAMPTRCCSRSSR